MLAKDIMTTDVVTVTPATPVRKVVQLLLKHNISALPVVGSEGRIVGIVGEGDLLHRAELGTEQHRAGWLAFLGGSDERAHEYVKSHGGQAADVMSSEVVTVTPDTPLAEVAQLLDDRNTRRVLVVQGGRLVGILSRADLVRRLASRPARAEAEPAADDQTIRERLLETLRSERWANTTHINVFVKDGVVELWGSVDSEEEAHAVRIAASTIPGVRTVQDHLATISAWAWAE